MFLSTVTARKPKKQVVETQLQTFARLGTYKLVIFVFNVREICKGSKSLKY